MVSNILFIILFVCLCETGYRGFQMLVVVFLTFENTIVRGRSYDRRRSPLRYSRSPRRYARRYSRSPDYYSPSPKRRGYSRYATSHSLAIVAMQYSVFVWSGGEKLKCLNICDIGQYHQETGGTERDLTQGHPTVHAAGLQAGVGAGAGALTTLDELLLSGYVNASSLNDQHSSHY